MAHAAFGYAESEITPDRSLSLEGYEFRGEVGAGNAGVLDPISARALWIGTDGGEAADAFLLVSLDVCEFVPALADRLRAAASDRSGVPAERIAVAATHTHSGPVLDELWGARDLADASAARHRAALASYVDDLTETVAVVAALAAESRRPCRMQTASYSATIGYNRRTLGENGETKMLFGLWQHPGASPDGPYDPLIPIVVCEAIDEPDFDDYLSPRNPDRVVLFNVAAHPVVLGQMSRLVSADYPGAARRYIEEHLGAGTKAIFLLGACGDTQPMLSTQSNPAAVEVVGTAVGAGVVAALACRLPAAYDGTTGPWVGGATVSPSQPGARPGAVGAAGDGAPRVAPGDGAGEAGRPSASPTPECTAAGDGAGGLVRPGDAWPGMSAKTGDGDGAGEAGRPSASPAAEGTAAGDGAGAARRPSASLRAMPAPADAVATAGDGAPDARPQPAGDGAAATLREGRAEPAHMDASDRDGALDAADSAAGGHSARPEAIEVHVVAFGNVALVGICAEVFTEFGINLRRASPFPTTLICTLANGTVGYVPTEEAFRSDQAAQTGDYEVAVARSHGIDEMVFRRLFDRCTALLNEAWAGGAARRGDS